MRPGAPNRSNSPQPSNHAPIYVRIDEVEGTTGGSIDTTDPSEPDGEGRAPPMCDWLTFGRTNRLTIKFFDDIRPLSMHQRTNAAIHRRSTAGVTNDQWAPDLLGMTCDELAQGDPTAPFHSLVHLKIDPILNILFGDSILSVLTRDLGKLIRDRLEELANEFASTRVDPSNPERWPQEPSIAVGHLRVLPLSGLDAAEILLIARASNLETLSHLEYALNRLTVNDLDLAESDFSILDEASLETIWRAIEVAPADRRNRVSDTTLWSYCRGVAGIPKPYVTGVTDGPRPDPALVAYRSGRLSIRMNVRPGDGPAADRKIDELGDVFAARTRFSRLGKPAIVVTGDEIGGGPGPSTFEAIATLLERTRIEGTTRSSTAFEVNAEVMALPPGFRHLARGEGAGLQHRYADVLQAQQRRWLSHRPDAPYQQLSSAAEKGWWSFSRTTSALALLEAIVALVADRTETEAYLDLIPPLIQWVREVTDSPDPKRSDEQERIYKNLERLMHVRSHQAAPHRSIGISLAFESRPAAILPRDCFRAYLNELCRARLQNDTIDILIDGAESRLAMKSGLQMGLFIVGALRLTQPLLWPNVVHEVEHLRLQRPAVSPFWNDRLLAFLGELELGLDKSLWEPHPGRRSTYHEDIGRVIDSVERQTRSSRDSEVLTLRICLGAIAEIACDIAIVDAGVLGDPAETELVRSRWIWCAFPNIATDLRERAGQTVVASLDAMEADPSPSPASITDGVELAIRAVFRVTSVMVLCGHDTNSSSLASAITEILEMRPHQERIARLICEVARDSEDDVFAKGRTRAAATLVSIACAALSRLCHHRVLCNAWVRALELVHALRVASPRAPSTSAIQVIASYVGDAHHQAVPPGAFAICPPLSRKGGVLDASRDGRRQAERLPGLYQDLRRAVRHHRIRCLHAFLHPEDVKPLATSNPAVVPPQPNLAPFRTGRHLVVHYPGGHTRENQPWELDLIRAARRHNVEVAGVGLAPASVETSRADVENLWRMSSGVRQAIPERALPGGFIHLILVDQTRAFYLPIHVGAAMVMSGDRERALTPHAVRRCLVCLESHFSEQIARAPERVWCGPIRALDEDLREKIYNVATRLQPGLNGP